MLIELKKNSEYIINNKMNQIINLTSILGNNLSFGIILNNEKIYICNNIKKNYNLNIKFSKDLKIFIEKNDGLLNINNNQDTVSVNLVKSRLLLFHELKNKNN